MRILEMKRQSKLLCILILLIMFPVFTSAAQPPNDVNKTDPAYELILKVLDSGLMEGYPDGSFRGKQVVDRNEMALFVARLIDVLSELEKDNAVFMQAEKTALKTDNPMVKELLSLVSQLQTEFETELVKISDRYYNLKLDYGKLEEALQNLELMQQGLVQRLEDQQKQIQSLEQGVDAIKDINLEVDSLRKDVLSLRQEVTDQSKTIKSLFIALGVMSAVILLVGLK